MRKTYFLILTMCGIFFIMISYLGNNRFTNISSPFDGDKLKTIFTTLTANNYTTVECITAPPEINFLKRYPFILNCNSNYTKPFRIDTVKDVDYSTVAGNLTHEYRIVRGVVVYFPVERFHHFHSEFKWLYHSWIEMQKYEPVKWRTDLLVFVDGNHRNYSNIVKSFFNNFNCSFVNYRSTPVDTPICRLVQYSAFKDRKLNMNVTNVILDDEYQQLLHKFDIFNRNDSNLKLFEKALLTIKDYSYLDSILVAFEGYRVFKSVYNFLIRSDMDTFLTPLFGQWLPQHCNDFYVGRGGYSNIFNVKRLRRIASNLNLKYSNVLNLGSTWYSTPEQFRLVSYLTLFCIVYLSNEEFSTPEKHFVSPILWPYWHYGVVLLYGQNLALNHLITTNQVNIVSLQNMIDYPTDNEKPVSSVLHLHVFHGNRLFSKFEFKDGKYDNKTISDDQLEKINYYALNIALQSKFMPVANYTEYFSSVLNKKT